jgi:hypothetical protein
MPFIKKLMNWKRSNKMQQLYQIANEYTEAFNKLEELDFDQQTIEDSLSLIKTDFDSKAINVGSFIKNLESNIKAMRDAESSIANRRKILQNKIDSIKEYLKTNMEKCGIKHIHSPYFDIKLKKCPDSVKITNEDTIPFEYKRLITEIKPDKDAIKKAIKECITIEGCSLVQNNRVEIK